MLDANFIKEYATRSGIPNRPRQILAEYLQSEILHILYTSKFGPSLTFMGGTALRFAYAIKRFSEVLDFEQIGQVNIESLAEHLKKELERLGFFVETRVKRTENIIIIFIKFSKAMQWFGISGMSDQKMKIKFEIDPNPAKAIAYSSTPVSTFGSVFDIITNTPETIFAQKIIALLFRPYQKGRDFYDIVWFLLRSDVEPNYALLQEKGINAKSRRDVSTILQEKISRSDLERAAQDVERFLFVPEQKQWILGFRKYLQEWAKV